MISLTDELTTEKLKYMELQEQLNVVSTCEEDVDKREEYSGKENLYKIYFDKHHE
ncbi:hypothetical protein BUALT_Bualt06G0068400 [Buddleja alternifolia]|uniref:Uncharacterized protein n=1 Tax=Buddleja alternifolia TaxID=168488 RepID=A0AAV6XCU4_9LAMI|nr:hypothetical protein BUALT_Bualt06G0068400 [Buddleja alternifolia]